MKKQDNRLSSNERGYDTAWRRIRALKISINPLCERCLSKKLTVPAAIVHHKKTIKEYPALRLDIKNLESLCFQCHENHHKLKSKGCGEDGIPIDKKHAWNKKL